jgi:hypothetical protein
MEQNMDRMLSRHLWVFNVSARFYTIQNCSSEDCVCEPLYLIREVACWVFGQSNNVQNPDIGPNEPPAGDNYLLYPTELSYKQWFYYDQTGDPLFGGRPTIYIPWTV